MMRDVKMAVVVASVGLVLVMSQVASAQRGFGFFGGTVAEAQLVELEAVQADLALSADQKTKVGDIAETLRSDRRELFQGSAGGDFAALREQMDKLNREATAKVHAVLNDTQKKRLREIAIQVNGPSMLADPEVGTALALTDEQKKRLEDVTADNAQALRDAREDLGGASPEERRERLAELRREGDQKLLAILTDAQREKFEAMKGKIIEIDRSQLFRRRGN